MNLLGSFLVFLALKSQVRANELLQDQIEDEKNEKALATETENLSQLFKYLDENIKGFRFTSLPEYYLANKQDLTLDYEYSGGEAFEQLFKQMRCHYHGPQSALEEHQSVAELISILTLMDLLINKLLVCKCGNREMLLTLVKHQFMYKMTTSIKKQNIDEMVVYYCDTCQCDHGLPEHIRTLVKNIQYNLKDI